MPCPKCGSLMQSQGKQLVCHCGTVISNPNGVVPAVAIPLTVVATAR